MNIAVLEFDAVGIALKNGVLRIANIEALHDLCYRAGEVGQQVSRDCLVITAQTWNRNVIHIGHGHSAGAQFHTWREPRIVP